MSTSKTQPFPKRQRFADTRYCSISKEVMVRYLCNLWGLPQTQESYDSILLPIPNRVGLTEADLVYKPGPPDWSIIERIQYLSQDDDLWHIARVRPRLKTASNLSAALAMTDPTVATRLKVSDFMVSTAEVNEHWEESRVRDLHPCLPKTPLDALAGAVFTTQGKEHETNVHVAFCIKHPRLRSREQGLTYLTPRILERYPMYNKLTGERFTYDTLLKHLMFAASPDTVFTDMDTGEETNGEWKAASNLIPGRGNPNRAGVDFFLNKNTKPYPYIRSYYVPQAQLQLLVCENEKSHWGCWTLVNGMRTWIIMKSRLYLELMFTILVFIQCEFADKQRPFPTDYFASVASTPIGKLYEQFIALNERIINNKEPTIAYENEFYSDTHKMNNDVIGLSEGAFPPMHEIYFPELPPELPAYAAVGIVLQELLVDKSLAQWTTKPGNLAVRCNNLTELMNMEKLYFLKKVIETNILVGKQPTPLDTTPEIAEHPNTQMYRLNRAEKFILPAAMTLYKMQGMHSDYLLKELDINPFLGPHHIEAVMKDMIRKLAVRANAVKLDTHYGVHPPNTMFVLLRDAFTARKTADDHITALFMLHFVWNYYKVVSPPDAKQTQVTDSNTMEAAVLMQSPPVGSKRDLSEVDDSRSDNSRDNSSRKRVGGISPVVNSLHMVVADDIHVADLDDDDEPLIEAPVVEVVESKESKETTLYVVTRLKQGLNGGNLSGIDVHSEVYDSREAAEDKTKQTMGSILSEYAYMSIGALSDDINIAIAFSYIIEAALSSVKREDSVEDQQKHVKGQFAVLFSALDYPEADRIFSGCSGVTKHAFHIKQITVKADQQ